MNEQPEASIEEIKHKILEFAEPHCKEAGECLALIESLYIIYIRENVTGPSIYTRYVEEEKRPL